MRAQRAGVIITISSVAAWEQYPNVAYKATKAGMIAFTQQVAIQNAEFGVRANVILPGLIDTPMAQALVWRLAGAFDRADDQHVAAAVAGSPNSNPIYVGLRKCLSERDRIAIIADLFPGVDFLARLSAARAKIPVVEYQCAKAGQIGFEFANAEVVWSSIQYRLQRARRLAEFDLKRRSALCMPEAEFA